MLHWWLTSFRCYYLLYCKELFLQIFLQAEFFVSDFEYKFTPPWMFSNHHKRQMTTLYEMFQKARCLPVTKSLLTRLRTLGCRITTVHWFLSALILRSKKSKKDLGTEQKENLMSLIYGITDCWNITIK